VRFMADYIKNRWRGIPGVKAIVMGDTSFAQVHAARELGPISMSAEIQPDRERYGHSIVKMQLYRPPNPAERQSLSRPAFIPKPPPGSKQSTLGGGAPGTILGRIHQVIVPGGLDATLSWYQQEFARDGWEYMGQHKSETENAI